MEKLEQMVKKEYIERNFVYSDVHYPEHDVKALNCATQIMSNYKPHRIILLGDFMDMTPVSHWLQDKKRPMEGKRLLKDYEGANAVLNDMVSKAGKQLKEVVYVLGNHEDWVNQYLDKYPQMEGMIEVENNIKLENKSVKLQYVEFNKFYKLGKLYLTHGLYINKYHAAKTIDMTGKSVLYAHSHDIQSYFKSSIANDEKHMAQSIGCLCTKSPHFMRNRPHNWMHGCALVDVMNGGNFTSIVVPIYDGRASVFGKEYNGKK
jgi:predicted MPP superfamily phosphohydrolase